MACPEEVTADRFETQLGTNHFAHFLLFYLMQPVLPASSFSSGVVTLASSAHIVTDVHGPQNPAGSGGQGLGYASWAYNPDGERRLWHTMLELLKLDDL
jgi:NAD(P)-dependent dehydrogenase (short-subunit alcohol dehydrogenase family)